MKWIKCSFLMLLLLTLLNTSCSSLQNGNRLFPVQLDDLWGYVDNKGNLVIEPQFEYAGFFHDGLAKVRIKNKVGYITPKGKFAIAANWEDGTKFDDGLAFVVPQNGYPQCINTKGEVLYTLDSISEVSSFQEGYAVCNIQYSSGCSGCSFSILINKEGLPLDTIDNKYDFFSMVSEGVSVISYEGFSGYTIFDPKTGKSMSGRDDAGSAGDFSEGYCVVGGYSGGEGMDIKGGYINHDGELVIPYKYEQARDFHDSLAAVSDFENGWGFIDKKGNYVIQPTYKDVGDFSEGLAPVKINGLWGYINKKGTLVVKNLYRSVSPFKNGVAFVSEGDKYAMIDTTGQLVVSPTYTDILKSDEGDCQVKSTYCDPTEYVGNVIELISIMNKLCQTHPTLSDLCCDERFSKDLQCLLRYDVFRRSFVGEHGDNSLHYRGFPDGDLGSIENIEEIVFHFNGRIHPEYVTEYGVSEDVTSFDMSIRVRNIVVSLSIPDERMNKNDLLAKIAQHLSDDYGYTVENSDNQKYYCTKKSRSRSFEIYSGGDGVSIRFDLR